MNFDWQTILVLIIVSLATAFVLRRVWQRLRAFSPSGKTDCATGCGKCAATSKSAPADFAKSDSFNL